jgi:hypothetical protein
MPIDHQKRIGYGKVAVQLGAPEHRAGDDELAVIDTLANVLHYAASRHIKLSTVIDTALLHVQAETGVKTDELRPEHRFSPRIYIVTHTDQETDLTFAFVDERLAEQVAERYEGATVDQSVLLNSHAAAELIGDVPEAKDGESDADGS